MKDNKKSRSLLQQQTGEKQERTVTFMPLINFITKFRGSKAYFRGLVVRVIEDFIILFLLIAAAWSLAYVASGVFKMLGVG